jgi:membrane-associated protein
MDLISDILGALFPPTTEKLAHLVAAMGPWFYVLLFGVVFIETGLVVWPWLPGDSLLFAAGALTTLPGSPVSLPLLIVLLITAAVVGDTVNYTIGYHVGPKVFRSERSRFFNKKHLLRAQAFYEKYGSKTLILARFVPIVRTFAPFVAGIGRMPFRRFILFSIIGGVAWVNICVLAGYFFGGFELVQRNFELVLVAVVAISLMPMAVEFVLSRWRKHKGQTVTHTPPQDVNHFVTQPAQSDAAVRQ